MEIQTIRRCEKCGSNNLTMLFIHYICNVCEPPPTASARASATDKRGGVPDPTSVGYIVWRSRPPGSCEYVFETVGDCERWRAAAGLERFPVRRVATSQSFRWRNSTGSVKSIILADRLFEIFYDSGHEPGPSRAYLDD